MKPTVSMGFIKDTGHKATQLSKEQIQANVKKVNQSESKEDSNEAQEVRPLTTEELLKNKVDNKELDTIGVLSLPDVSIKLPILDGVTYETMMYGAGTIKGDEVMGQGNYSLASHTIFNTYTNSIENEVLFGNLVKSREGQRIYVTDKTKVYEYVIDKVYTVKDNQSDVINDKENKKEITLVTCTSLTGNDRLIVHGNLEETLSYQDKSDLF
ncbi:class A sortase [Lactococcus formosensis subsp. bovis]|uniref:class A sortase n=1 Tax=Lactococcus formosensis TaxID=1281486 RepID=UPI0020BFC13E|nr:class A sortase [Lactococcus formosensis]